MTMLTTLRRVPVLLAIAAGPVAVSKPAKALPQPCIEAASPETIAAVVMAQRQFEAAWAPYGTGRITHYVLRAQPRHPFAIGPQAAPVEATDLPDGLVLAEEVRCTTHEIGADAQREIVVTYAGYGLRFHDATDGWSRPLEFGRLMVIAVRPAASRPSPRLLSDARTILPPEATLRHPATPPPPLPLAQQGGLSPSGAVRTGRRAP